ncbi:MAG TPA: phage holin family protein [Longimicrobiales bacterium]|nr:phage holin family protein [Longimicrobiales bacterium]
MAELSPRGTELYPHRYNGAHDDVGLKTLLKRLNEDASQFVHDELELAKLEVREVAGALSNDVREAGQTLAKDLAKVGVALSLALMGGLALTAGAVLAIGELLGDAFWAGGLIVGIVLLIAAALAGKSAASDAQSSSALRLENTRRTMQRDKQVLADEMRETKEFAQREAQEFKEHASPGGTQHRH